MTAPPPSDDFDGPAWIESRWEPVMSEVRRQIEALALSPRQREMLSEAVGVSICGRFPGEYCAPVHLPLLVHAGITGDERPAIPLAAATVMVWAGAELYDNLLDGDLPPSMSELGPNTVTMMAMSLGLVMPVVVANGLDADDAARGRVVGRLTRGLHGALHGQESEMSWTGSGEVSPAEVERSVREKNGEPKALFTALSAELAGAPESVVQAYADFGLAFGVVCQLQSDAHELFAEAWCRDLAQGTRTLHVALAMEALAGAERDEFVQDLELARSSEDAQDRVRRRLRGADVMYRWTEVVGHYAGMAEQALETANAREPARRILLDLLRMRSPRCQGGRPSPLPR